jgi:hypothetical protein
VCKNGPVTVDGAIFGVYSVGQGAVVAELGANINGDAGLVSVAIIGSRRIPPVAVLRLVADFGECQLRLAVDLVVREASTGAMVPLGNGVAVS